MGMPCSICSHERHGEIDQAIIANEPIAQIARKFGVSRPAINRHREAHLPVTLAAARDTLDTSIDDNIFDRLVKKRKRADSIAHQAHEAGNFRTAVAALAEARKCEELEARARGEFAANAIPRADLIRIMNKMKDAVAEHVTDPDVLEAIRDKWAAIDV